MPKTLENLGIVASAQIGYCNSKQYESTDIFLYHIHLKQADYSNCDLP